MADLGSLLEVELQQIPSSVSTVGDVARRRDRRRRNRRIRAAVAALVFATIAFTVLGRAFSRVERRIPASRSPGTIVFSRQLAGSEQDYLFAAEADGSAEAQLVPTGVDLFAVSPDGTQVPYGDIKDNRTPWILPAVVDLDGIHRYVLLGKTKLPLWPTAWSPDGSRFLAQVVEPPGSSASGLYTARTADGGDLVQVTSVTDRRDRPIGYSPDGSRILFLRSIKAVSGGAQDLFVVNVDGSDLRQLNPPGTSLGQPEGAVGGSAVAGRPATAIASWSPDGSRVTFVASVGSPSQMRSGHAGRAVYVVDVDGTNAQRITPEGQIAGAQWSPDGRWLAFSEPDPSLSEVFVVHPDGTRLRAITSSADGLGSSGPVWSPDGSKLMFTRNPDGGRFHSQLWTVDVDGSGLTQLTNNPAEYFSYGWAMGTRS
jgi:Tol biopolymer transport system component